MPIHSSLEYISSSISSRQYGKFNIKHVQELKDVSYRPFIMLRRYPQFIAYYGTMKLLDFIKCFSMNLSGYVGCFFLHSINVVYYVH